MVKAARAEGLHVGFYYSHAFDWEDPNAPGNDWDYQNPGGDKGLFGGINWYNEHPELVPRIEKYVNGKAIPELKELIARYHPDILWFDTPSKLPFYEQAAIVKAVREADPKVVINGRAARTTGVVLGDYLDTSDEPEELRPTPGDWEEIPTTNESYGYNKLDTVHKPVAYFIQLLAKTSAKGGNILLNIGPRGDGIIDPAGRGNPGGNWKVDGHQRREYPWHLRADSAGPAGVGRFDRQGRHALSARAELAVERKAARRWTAQRSESEAYLLNDSSKKAAEDRSVPARKTY